MDRKVLFEIESLYRDNFRVTGLTFGKGEKSLCIMGNTRGNEYQQIYICSQLVKKLKDLESRGRIADGHEIMVIPSANPYSMNIEKRFWPTDNTDINRMFPGYALGETTQRIAAGLFDAIKDYEYGIQFASFYMPGDFTPHVRIMKTGMDYIGKAEKFGLPYIITRSPRPYDTTTLNYNWQIWDTRAFSLYSTTTERIDEESAERMVEAVLNFMIEEGIVTGKGYQGYRSQVVDDSSLVAVRPYCAGIFQSGIKVSQRVLKGQELAYILDPYDGSVREKIVAPVTGTVFFVHNQPMTYANTAVLKIVPTE
ncbi:M14 family metallopeptidase [Blautia sp. HCP3S3_G3]|uniref:M14 family metallopeptidase n=1 Tax=Blautia sp. HCP3S3_G3 TaxID=3438913 RepID=UPI003F89B8A8